MIFNIAGASFSCFSIYLFNDDWRFKKKSYNDIAILVLIAKYIKGDFNILFTIEYDQQITIHLIFLCFCVCMLINYTYANSIRINIRD